MRRSKGKDRLSDLPHGIQRHVLSLLPMKEAGKVGTLSKLWRMIWYSTPNLYFDYNEFPDGVNKLDRFRRIVDQTIALHDESDIEIFTLNFYIHELENGTAMNNQWIDFAIGHNVKKLSLCGMFDRVTNLPDSLFTSKNLEELDLALARLRFILPPNAALPNLRKLHMKVAILTEQSFTGDTSLSCPMLEDLSFRRCKLTNLEVFLISASKLKFFTMEGYLGIHNYVVNLHAPSLSALFILGGIARDYILNIPTTTLLYACANCEALDFMVRSRAEEEMYQPLIKIMQKISMARQLWFKQGSIEVLAHAHAHARALWDLHNSISFSNMTKLELDLWPTLHQAQMAILILHRSRNLIDLDIFMQRAEGLDFQMHNVELNLGNISFVLNELRHVLINNFKAEKNEMVLVKFLLSNAPKLVSRKIVKKSPDGIITSEVTLNSDCEEEYQIAASGDEVLLSLTAL